MSGAWDIRALESRARALKARLDELAGNPASWDLSAVQRLDHIGALLLWRAWGKLRPASLSLRPEHEIFFANLEGEQPAQPAGRRFAVLLPATNAGGGRLVVRKLREDINFRLNILAERVKLTFEVEELHRHDPQR